MSFLPIKLSLAIICGISAIVLSSCAKTLDARKIEETIKSELNNQGKLSVESITCPKGIKLQSGQSFECTGELKPDGGFFVTVTQTDDAGNVSWDVPNSWRLLNLSKLESEFRQTLAAKSTVPIQKIDCGGLYRPTKPGDSFECQLQFAKAISSKAIVGEQAKGNKPGKTDAKILTKPAQPNLTSTTLAVQVKPEGEVTWQEVQTIKTISTVATSRGTVAPGRQTTGTTPVQQTTDTTGKVDATGWPELGD
jgi:hypothetical protein